MDEFFEAVAKQFPTLITVTIIVVVCYIVIREFKANRAETERVAEKIINAKLGETLSAIQEKISNSDSIFQRQVSRMSELNERFDQFSSEISIKEAATQELFDQATKQLGKLRDSIPDVDNESAFDIYLQARESESSAIKAGLCLKLLEHDDVTSPDLELAGDLMRQAKRTSLAMKLYRKAHETDPENKSAKIEYLALLAELSHKERKMALEKSKCLVISERNTNWFRRICDTLIEISYYEELVDFSQKFIESVENEDHSARAAGLRNKAVALRTLGRIEESAESYELALKLSPDDENVYRPYLYLLEQQGRDALYVEIAKKLISLDPSDVSYYLSLAEHLFKRGKYEEARRWLNWADNFQAEPLTEIKLRTLTGKLNAAEALKAFLEE